MNRYEINGEVTTIFIDRKDGSSLECLIDTEDLEKLLELGVKWTAMYVKKQDAFYVKSVKMINKNRFDYLLHRFILNPDDDIYVDHINGNRLDNRKTNLRFVTPLQSAQNISGRKNSTSDGARGINWQEDKKKWRARVHVDGKTHHIGYYNELDDAKKAVAEARIRMMPYSVER